MPITTIGSYAPTLQEFINHWTAVNATLGNAPLTLKGGYTLANLVADRDEITAAINSVIARNNAAAVASGDLVNLKTAARTRVIQFRKWAAGYLPGTGYVRSLPDTPTPTAVESRFVDPLQTLLSLWTAINEDPTLSGVPLPVTLAGDYVLADFAADLTALRAAYSVSKGAQEQATLLRKQRDTLLKPAMERLKQYRDVVLARFDANSAFAASLPALSPPPGATPDPVEVTAVWDAATGRAVLNWTASPAATLARYSVRACMGARYKAADEFIVADLAPDTRTLSTLDGLPVPGTFVVYRVYVVLTTGNERGSNDAPVTRPAAS